MRPELPLCILSTQFSSTLAVVVCMALSMSSIFKFYFFKLGIYFIYIIPGILTIHKALSRSAAAYQSCVGWAGR